MRFYVLPESRNDDGSCLRVYTQKPGEPLIQLELKRLVVQKQENCAFDVAVSRTLNLTEKENVFATV